MDSQIALLLVQDGIVNGAVYGLMGLALVLVFSVTRVVFIPQGELVAFAALSMAALHSGGVPRALWLLLALSAATLLVEAWRQRRGTAVDWASTLVWTVAFPVRAVALVWLRSSSLALQALTTLVVVVPLGPLLYRLAYRPLADATVLMLLIVSVALHGVMVGLGLLFFGAEGSRTPAFSDLRLDVGGLQITGQSLVVVAVTVVLVFAMFRFFGRSMIGKALRATAINRVGARLMGIPTELSGDLSFALASLIGAVSGLLIGPLTTVYYDTGFLIGLKGFIAAIIGGLVSYPLTAVAALLVGCVEAFSSFYASNFKEVIVFTLILPVLVLRSLTAPEVEEEKD